MVLDTLCSSICLIPLQFDSSFKEMIFESDLTNQQFAPSKLDCIVGNIYNPLKLNKKINK